MVSHIAQQKIPITLCLNKIDRLIIELKLPPEDAYYKIKQVIDEVNALIKTHGGDDIELLSPIETKNPKKNNNILTKYLKRPLI